LWDFFLISLNYKGHPVLGLANFPILKKYYFNSCSNSAFVSEYGKKRRIKVNRKATFSNMKLSAAFHGSLSLNQQKKIPQILKQMQFPCSDALSYSHFAEGKLDVVIQCGNKIWDIHALIPIIRAAGGIVTTWKNIDAKKAGNIVCSANKSLHNKMLKILKPVSK
jgi:fructose-1,6-bisphosphatase/inositol monophosphatase family enzyme